MFVVTDRATTFASAQAESMAAIRATLARTAMIFAARSDPRAIVLTDTNARLFQYLGFNRFSSQPAYAKRERGYITDARFVKISIRRLRRLHRQSREGVGAAGRRRKKRIFLSASPPAPASCSCLSFIYVNCGYQTGETSSLTFICAVVVIISRSELKAGLIQQQDFGA